MDAIPSLRSLRISPDTEGKSWVWFEDFVNLLKDHRIASDSKVLRSDIIETEIKRHKGSFQNVDGKKQISVNAVLRYVFRHCDDFKFCKEVSSEIEAHILHQSSSAVVTSIFELYKEISISFLKNTVKEQLLFSTFEINESQIPTLHSEYKCHFTDESWKRICFFEWHFSQECDCDIHMTYEEEVRKRWAFFDSIRVIANQSLIIEKQCRENVLKKLKRKACASSLNGILVSGAITHIPALIDLSIFDVLSEHDDCVSSVTCVDSIGQDTGIQVFIEIDPERLESIKSLSTIVESHLCNEHREVCTGIVFCSPFSFKQYKAADGTIQRFHLRDAFFSGQLKENVLYYAKPQRSVPFDTGLLPDKCAKCFNSMKLKPLDWQNFNLMDEWNLEVPLSVQLLLESFTNKYSLRKTSNKEILLNSKIVRLHNIFDALLNVLNRTYSGVLQDLNTRELSVNYHNVQTVFSITNSTGGTSSLRTAERFLKTESDEDVCYYNTFIRRYPLEYTTGAGKVTANVNLRGCILVFYMDNLVRLTFQNDASRGVSHSTQVPMLPITVKGVPLDASEVDTWHDVALCDGTSNCACKDAIELTKDDVDKVLLTLTEEEMAVQNVFRQLTTWGVHTVLHQVISQGEVQNVLLDNITVNPTEDDLLCESIHEDVQPLNLSECSTDGPDIHETSVNTASAADETECDDLYRLLHAEEKISKEGDTEDNEFYQLLEDSIDDSLITDKSKEISTLITGISELSCIHEEKGEMDIEELKGEAVPSKNLSQNLPQVFGLHQYKPPPMLCRHPPPAVGRDDDKEQLRHILNDILMKAGYTTPGVRTSRKDRILFGPDHKVGKNLLQLISEDKKFEVFLPEFPLLHLRKSKITTIGSAYKHAGIIHLLKYMRDEDQENEWAKLATTVHIEAATRVMRRLSLSLHVAFLLVFMKTMTSSENDEFKDDIQTKHPKDLCTKWDKKYQNFLMDSSTNNATFALHVEIMKHLDEVGAIAMAEKMGGTQGYQLLLAAVKESLPFAFLNGASAYATYCTRLIYEHYRAGPFHQNLKTSLYSSPHKGSQQNFGLDTQREMEHRDAIKGFRPGATVAATKPRLSLVDTLNEAHEKRMSSFDSVENSESLLQPTAPVINWDISSKDLDYIIPVVGLIMRQKALSVEPDSTPKNVYASKNTVLSDIVLDRNTWDVGKFLIKHYVCKVGLFGLSPSDCPTIADEDGPKALVSRVRKSKSTTIKRLTERRSVLAGSQKEAKDKKWQSKVTRQKKLVECLSSEMNTCQAVVKPDCTKTNVQKSTGMKTAILNLLQSCLQQKLEKDQEPLSDIDVSKIITQDAKKIPPEICRSFKFVTVEFAGTKFKIKADSGKDYIQGINRYVIQPIISIAPNANKIVICEEKYKFTPDDLKAATRSKRNKSKDQSIGHLKTGSEMLNDDKLDRLAINTTEEGKSIISTYLAKNISDLDLKRNINIIIDSELILGGCVCKGKHPCDCPIYTIPIEAQFTCDYGYSGQKRLDHILQRKGEAEMAQVDWLFEGLTELNDGDSVLSVVTSGDIDSVIIHMFSLSHKWPRNSDGKFKFPVYVLLQKPSPDLYNITSLLELLEAHFKDHEAGRRISLGLCLGGNDFLPKFHGITHDKVLKTVSKDIFKNLFTFHTDEHVNCVTINEEVYKKMITHLYTPSYLNPEKLTNQAVRQLSIKLPRQDCNRNPQLWMPPESALTKLSLLIQCQIDYLLTVGDSAASLPDFLERGCLKKVENLIEYDLGVDSRVENWRELLHITDAELVSQVESAKLKQTKGKKKRTLESTPQKGRRKKKQKPKTSTPK